MPDICPEIQQTLNTLKSLKHDFDASLATLLPLSSLGPRNPEVKQAVDKAWDTKVKLEQQIINMEQELKYLSFAQLQTWLKDTKVLNTDQSLESRLEGGSLEALIKKQEQFYQKMYGPDFKIDRSIIKIDKSRLKAIAQGLETGAINYPLIIATPETLSKEEQDQTQAQFAYHSLLEPLKAQSFKIWPKTGQEGWTTWEQVLQREIPVTLDDFKDEKGQITLTNENWIEIFQKIIKTKKSAPQVQPNQLELVFTDTRQDVPQDQKPVTSDGRELSQEEFQNIKSNRRFTEMIQNQVQALTLNQWIVLAAQIYVKDQIYLSPNTWDWTMTILDNTNTKDKNNRPISVAHAYSRTGGVGLGLGLAGGGSSDGRWRASL